MCHEARRLTSARAGASESLDMSLVSTTAFILKVDPLSEKDLVAALLTRDRGVVRAAVKGARGKTRRGAALQTLTEIRTTYFLREGADLARLDSIEIEKSAFRLAQRAETAMLLPYVAESVLTFVPELQPGDEVYRLTRHVLDALEAGVDAGLSARYFEIWLLRFAGLLPEDRVCARCGEPLDKEVCLDPDIPGFVHAACGRPGSLVSSAEALSFLALARRAKLTAWTGGAPSGAVLDAVESVTREIRRRFLGHELKSYRFLRSLE